MQLYSVRPSVFYTVILVMNDENNKLQVYFERMCCQWKNRGKNILFCRFSKKWYYVCLGEIIIPSEKKGRFVMKALSVSRLCLIITLMLGLLVAWAAAIPKVSNSQGIFGANNNGCDCYDPAYKPCTSIAGGTCKTKNSWCQLDDRGPGVCDVCEVPGSSCYPCKNVPNCANEAFEQCYGG